VAASSDDRADDPRRPSIWRRSVAPWRYRVGGIVAGVVATAVLLLIGVMWVLAWAPTVLIWACLLAVELWWRRAHPPTQDPGANRGYPRGWFEDNEFRDSPFARQTLGPRTPRRNT
jgi:hypothetical protein